MKISIEKGLISFEHNDFSIRFGVQVTSFSSGGGQEGDISISLDCIYEVKFNLPETNFELFDDYRHFALSMKEIIKRDLDYDSYLEKMSYKLLDSMNKKLDRLLTS